MLRPGRCAVAPGLLIALLLVAATRTGATDHAPDSPEARLRARIADLHADVELLKVECAAARHNLMETLKKSGLLDLGDRNAALSRIRDEIRQLKMMGQSIPLGGSVEFLGKLERDSSKGMLAGNKEQAKLMVAFLKGGDEGEQALVRIAELECQARIDSARAESDRRKADFFKKVRSLHVKKLELADAEAEYKSTR